VGPLGVAQIMSIIQKVADKYHYVKKMFVFNDISIETQNSLANAKKLKQTT
jgi:hypothetical protein